MHSLFFLAEGSLLLLGPDMLLVFVLGTTLTLGVVWLVCQVARRDRGDGTKPPDRPV